MKVQELIYMLQPFCEEELVVWDSTIQRYVPMEPEQDMVVKWKYCDSLERYHPSLIGKKGLQLEITGE